ncbi:hypothetical protein RN001_002174 [Aquatica leii]|nr:hypothetical protein RN001_002174 [Aquatica leii]
MSVESVIDKVGYVINAYCSRTNGIRKSLKKFEKWDLQFFPISFLINNVPAYELKEVWEDLPVRYQENVKLQLCLPCLRHYNKDNIQLDGPPPSIKMCWACKSEKVYVDQ